MTTQEIQEPVSKQFKAYILNIIQKIPEDQITEKMFDDCKNIFENIQKLDSVVVGGAIHGSITCKICGGHYKGKYRATHERTKRHVMEDAKVHHMYDFKNKEILSPKDLIQISTYRVEIKQ